MRTFKILIAAAGLASLLASSAHAYTMKVLPVEVADPEVWIGQLISYDVFLDTEGESGITLLSFSRTFDPTVLAYRPDLSDANDGYPLYAPAASKALQATWLVPNTDPPSTWGGGLPPIGGQVNVAFFESNLGETVATGTRVWLATLSFEVVGIGYDGGEWSFDHEGNTFLANGVEMKDDVNWVFVPEPTTALLLGVGLLGLGLKRRRG